jgi:hypothetical protein
MDPETRRAIIEVIADAAPERAIVRRRHRTPARRHLSAAIAWWSCRALPLLSSERGLIIPFVWYRRTCWGRWCAEVFSEVQARAEIGDVEHGFGIW